MATESDDYRIEHDTMGEVRVPAAALWRAQTQRAVENFPISFRPLERTQIRALGLLKAATAQVNRDLGLLDPAKADAIIAAAREIADGLHDDQFPIDVFQTGSGTSSNMNVNEVIASIAARNGATVHPNDDVNMSQSSNDTFPTAMHLAVAAGAPTVALFGSTCPYTIIFAAVTYLLPGPTILCTFGIVSVPYASPATPQGPPTLNILSHPAISAATSIAGFTVMFFSGGVTATISLTPATFAGSTVISIELGYTALPPGI